jgi:hypothetical protein
MGTIAQQTGRKSLVGMVPSQTWHVGVDKVDIAISTFDLVIPRQAKDSITIWSWSLPRQLQVVFMSP